MSTARNIIRNIFSLTAASIISKLLTLLVLAYAARVLQAEHFGRWSFALTVASYFGVLATLGLDTLAGRELAQNRGRLKNLVSLVISVKFLGSILGYLAVGVVMLLLPKPSEVKILLLLCYLPFALGFWSLIWVFIAIERLELMAVGQVVEQLVNAVAIFLMVHSPEHVLRVPIAAAVGATAGNLCMFVYFVGKFKPMGIRLNFSGTKSLLSQGMPFAITGVLSQLYSNFGTVMLSFMRSDAEVGWYNAAYRLLAPIITLRYTVIYSLNPTFWRLYAESHEKMTRLAKEVFRLSLFVAIPIGVGGTVLAKPIVQLVFGGAYATSAGAFAILVWSLAILFLNLVCPILLYAGGREKAVMNVAIAALVLNAALNYLMIPRWGIVGSALATVISDLLSLFALFALTSSIVALHPFRLLWRPITCAIVMGVFLWLFQSIHVLILIAFGAAIYGGGLFVLRAITVTEVRNFLNALRHK